jgi:predicted CopG family antitoxin
MKTIQLRDETYRMLSKLKEIKKARSFDEIIFELLMRELGVETEMFGVDRGKIRPFSPKDRMEDREW